MSQIQEDLSKRILMLERELKAALEDKEEKFRYRWVKGRATFEQDTLTEHRSLKSGLVTYLLHSRFLAFASAPVIYAGIVPFALMDAYLAVYQAICFPIYGVPKVKRSDYLVFDRGRLTYLNLLERLNCLYCSYANGLSAYMAEVLARTEQHWCPIKHAARLRSPHSRYGHFFDYGNANQYRQQIDTVRDDFVDLRTLTNGKK